MFWLFLSLIGDASFGSSFGSWLRTKPKQKVLVDKFWEDPWSTKTKPVLVKPKVVTKTCFITETNPFPTFDRIIQLKMGSMFLPAASSSLPLPICYRSSPAIPSLGDCFPCGSIDLGKYVLYSSTLRQRARWHTSLALLFGGHGMSPFADNSVNADERREPKTRMQRFVYARRDTEDGPLEIIPPEESTWYKFYVCNFYITQDTWIILLYCSVRIRLCGQNVKLEKD
jgi:hypothetical protein